MKFKIAIIGCMLTFLSTQAVYAKLDGEFTGYLEDTIMGEYIKDDHEENVSNIVRARLNYSGKYNNVGDFSLTFIGVRYSGATSVDLTKYLPREDARKIPVPVDYELENDYWLQEAFGSLYLNRVMLRAGRQKYYTGTGYAWNPTDLFNRKNVFDPTYEIEGLDSVLTTFSFPENLKLSLFYSFDTNDENDKQEKNTVGANDWQVKIETRARMWDCAIVYSDVKKIFLDAGTFNIMQIKWQLLSTEFSGELFGIGVHAEGGYAWLESETSPEKLPEELKNHARFLLGCDYTFENELFLMAEYYFEGLGETVKDDYSLNNRIAYFTGNMDSIGRDNLFLGMRYPVSDLATFEFYGIFNLSDPSVILNPWITWIASDDIVVNFSAQIPLSENESASLGRSGSSVFIRMNFSF